MASPSAGDAEEYLSRAGSLSVTPPEVAASLAAESAAQAHLCATPADGEDWPADLLEALYRRVAHNLALRANPSGVSTAESEFGTSQLRVGGEDAEVRRLEAPYRRIVVA